MKHYFSVLVLLFPLCGICQDVIFRGKVTGTDAAPVAGATITIRGSGRSAVSDAGGGFSLPGVQPGDTLQVSAIGFEPRALPAGKRIPLTVVLTPRVTALEEVTVSTGYQSLPRERATGSFTTLPRELLRQQPTSGLLDRLPLLAGSLALVPSSVGPQKMTLRGFSTIMGPSDPLIVLDHFPYEGAIGNINPADVESITLLKDAAAASIWGTRAANGVLVITTRKGRFNQPLQVEASVNVTRTGKPDLFATPRMNTADFVDVEQFLYNKRYRLSDTASRQRYPVSMVYEILLLQRAGRITPEEAAARLEALRSVDVRRQYFDHVYRRALNRQYHLNLRGGAQNMAWLASAGYDQSEDVLGAPYRRLTLRTDNTWRLHPAVELSAGAQGAFSRRSSGRTGYGDIPFTRGGLAPYTRLIDEEGNALPVYHQYRKAYLDTAGGGKLLPWTYYPLEDWRHDRDTRDVQDLTAHLGLSWKVRPFLTAAVKYRLERQRSEGLHLYGEESYYARNLVNQFTQVDRTTGTLTYRVPRGGILDRSAATLTSSGVRGQLTFDRRWGRHVLTLLGGGELSGTRNEGYSYRTYGYQPGILTFGAVDLTTTYPQFVTGSPSFIPDGSDISATRHRFVSFFGNGAWTWRDRYTLSASARRDASNLFGLATNDKWTPLWSAGAAWLLSGERFYNWSGLPHLRLKATFGYRGNIDPTMSAATTILYSTPNPFTGAPTASVRNFYNPELRWEKTGMLNLAVEGRSRGNRLSFTLEYFHKKCRDLYGYEPLDLTVGLQVSNLVKNVAILEGRGVDLELHSVNLRGPLTWTTQLNVHYYRDRVQRSYALSKNGSSYVGAGNRALEGYPLYTFFAYRWAGLDPATGDPQGFLNGQVSKDYNKITGSGTLVSDLAYLGSSLPVVYGTMGNTLSWKGLSLTARIGWKAGYYFRRASIDYSDLFNRAHGHGDYTRRWQKAGDEQWTDVPSMPYPVNTNRDRLYNYSEATAERADHLRLHYLNLAWELPRERGRKGLDRVRLHAGWNPDVILWRANKYGLDPDYDDRSVVPGGSWVAGLSASL